MSQERNWIMKVPLAQIVVPPSCLALLITVALAVAPSIACLCRSVRRCRAAAAAVASMLLPPCCCRCTVRRRRTVVAAALPPSCRHRRCRYRRSAICWLVVALLSTVQFCHCMPSCDRWHSHCRREHFCTNWCVLIGTTSILAINIATRTNCTNLYKKLNPTAKISTCLKSSISPLSPGTEEHVQFDAK